MEKCFQLPRSKLLSITIQPSNNGPTSPGLIKWQEGAAHWSSLSRLDTWPTPKVNRSRQRRVCKERDVFSPFRYKEADCCLPASFPTFLAASDRHALYTA